MPLTPDEQARLDRMHPRLRALARTDPHVHFGCVDMVRHGTSVEIAIDRMRACLYAAAWPYQGPPWPDDLEGRLDVLEELSAVAARKGRRPAASGSIAGGGRPWRPDE